MDLTPEQHRTAAVAAMAKAEEYAALLLIALQDCRDALRAAKRVRE